MMARNEGMADRCTRATFGEILFLAAFFWVGGTWQIVACIAAAIMFVTAVSGVCPFYTLFGIDTGSGKPIGKKCLVVFFILFAAMAVGGSYASTFFSKKFFLDDYSRMNEYYKQTLFNTGQEKRAESVMNYDKLVAEFGMFQEKYTAYHPYVVRGDDRFDSDLRDVSEMIADLKEQVYVGDLKSAHLGFEAVRPIFQDILKRNGFSMLAVVLVDFHDAMETVIGYADAKDAAGILNVYPEVDIKLKAVEEIANDAEIRAIRQKLDEIDVLAREGKQDELAAKAAELKSSFVKVYLKRG